MLKLADKWYQRKHISDDITLIFEPHVHPFLRCNIWHIRGQDHDLLVDTGLGVSSLKQEIQDLVDKPITAVATHIHYDHVGCLHEFEQRVVHRLEAPGMQNYREFCLLRKSDFPPELHQDLATSDQSDYLLTAVPALGFSIDDYQIRSTTPTWIVEEGDVIDLGNRHFEVFHLPGHSPGSLGLWEQSTGTLFSGDALYDGHLLDELPDSSIPDYLGTMKRIRDLPVNVVHAGHEPSFGRARMVELIDAYLEWRGG